MLKHVDKSILLIAFFAVFVLEWFTPIHSDDYRYALLGVSFDAHLNHYLTWSGRVVADYVSALLLATESRWFVSTMTGLVVVAFCYFIVKTPTGTLKWKKHDALILTLIFLTFWVANPNIGQTVFWIVGSANYLWTNLFVAAWIWNLYRIQLQREERTHIGMLLLGLLAGCSNESVAPFVVGLALLAIVYDYWQEKRIIANKIAYFLSALVGASILIFSPGNFIRAQGAHTVWYDKSIVERITIHLSERFFNHLALVWISYVVLVLLAVLLFMAKRQGHRIKSANPCMVGLMLLVGLGTSFIMVASPSYPDRVMLSTFLFFLLALSFLAREVVTVASPSVMNGFYAITGLMAAVFIWSYTLMYAAYTRVFQQDYVRVSIVKSQLSQGHKDFTVPDFHFLKMQNSGGHFGFFHDPQVYGRYFGAENVAKEKVNFDYSVLANGKQQALGGDSTAWFNNRGDLMLVSKRPLTGTVQVKTASSDASISLARFTAAKINDEYWYFSAIPKEDVTHLALLP
ncbi:TPA: hypothetical protein OX923_001398 [Citrobacter farmeri]|uniref:DUF6056 family protein n=1 Tax=Citrobacter farmeri TaxID=67824 RepID=UPI002297398E|nr:DUF6056 family protein [Citrobacter farmeri]MEC3931816.1 DUF6056 family protein [Citrobacter farmeri]HCW7015843.1 hypothetical protein [Citrobacter farmeri]